MSTVMLSVPVIILVNILVVLLTLSFWNWILWLPAQLWDWRHPQGAITPCLGNGFGLRVTGEMQRDALVSFTKWADANPAPRWWRIWCKLLKKPTHQSFVDGVGLTIGAVPRFLLNSYLAIASDVSLAAEDIPPQLQPIQGSVLNLINSHVVIENVNHSSIGHCWKRVKERVLMSGGLIVFTSDGNGDC